MVGGTPEGEESYLRKLKDLTKQHNLLEQVKFRGPVSYPETKKWYNLHEVFINLSPTGYFDKTVLEAMSCECLPIVCNYAYKNIFPPEFLPLLFFKQNDIKDLSQKIEKVLSLSPKKKKEIQRTLRTIVIKKHSLSTFGDRLLNAFYL